MKRRLPRARDLAPLIQFKKPELNGTKRRLAAALTIDDLRRIAKRRTPKAAFDYTDGAAEEELSLARARQAFRDIEFHPTILRNVAEVDTGWDGARRPGRPAVRDRADRVHPADAHRGRDRRCARGGQGGHSVLAVDAGHHLHRGCQGREPQWAQLVSAVHVEGPRPVDGIGASAPPRRGSTPCWSPSTFRSRARGCATPATACPYRRR